MANTKARLVQKAALCGLALITACGQSIDAGRERPAVQDIDPLAQARSRYAVTVSRFDHDETLRRLMQGLDRRDLVVFAVVNHAAGAEEAGLAMPPASAVIFGSPQVGTSLMQAVPLLSTELPLRASVYQDTDGQVKVATTSVTALGRDYPELEEQAGKLQAIAANLQALRAEAAGTEK